MRTMDDIEQYIAVEDEMSFQICHLSEVSIHYIAEVDVSGQQLRGAGASRDDARLKLLLAISSAERTGQITRDELNIAVAAALRNEPIAEVRGHLEGIGEWGRIGWQVTSADLD
jgi:hypothetical protein